MYDQQNGGERLEKKGDGWAGKLALALSLVAVALAATALYLTLRGDGAEEPDPEPTIQFGGQSLDIVDGVPAAAYDEACFSVDGRGRMSYEEDGRRARTGIDVSVHQGEIDWPAVAEDGVEFAMLRLGYRGYTEGGLFLDSQFERNIRGALDAGLEVGVYFFSQATSPEEAREEAEFVLSALEGYDLTYPVAFDWETVSSQDARTRGMGGEAITQCALAFCDRVREAGYEPAVYFNQHLGYLYYDLRALTEYPIWLAEYDGTPDFYYHFDLWQYTHTGEVDGIQGDVDLNLDLRF